MGKWVKGVTRYKLPVIKQISPGDVMNSVATMVINAVMHIWKLQERRS